MTDTKINYDEYIRSNAWKSRRQQIIARCGGICEGCRKEKMVHVHHLTYERLGDELLTDLEGVCFPCHQDRHSHIISGDYRPISMVAAALGVTVHSVKVLLLREGWFDKIWEGTPQPTELAFESRMVQHSNKHSVWVWNYWRVKEKADACRAAIAEHQLDSGFPNTGYTVDNDTVAQPATFHRVKGKAAEFEIRGRYCWVPLSQIKNLSEVSSGQSSDVWMTRWWYDKQRGFDPNTDHAILHEFIAIGWVPSTFDGISKKIRCKRTGCVGHFVQRDSYSSTYLQFEPDDGNVDARKTVMNMLAYELVPER